MFGSGSRVPWFATVNPGLLAVYFLVLNGRIEVRERGVFANGTFYRWSSIESCAWEQAGDGFVFLKLRVWPWLPFLPRARKILVNAERKAEAAALLDRQFAVWPGHTIA
jgi:hypothetical protein